MSVVEAAAGKIAREHEAARRGAIVVDRSHEGRIRATGRDRNDLLHRMSTNDLTQMQVGEARPTVLTTAIARIVDLVWVLNYPNDLLMLVGPRQATNVRRWLSKYVFFQDEVVFTDASETSGQLGVYGPKAGDVAEALLPGAGRLTENHFLLEGDLTILRARPLAGDGFTVIAPSAQIPELKAKAQNAGAVQAGEDTYQVLRVEAGQPYTGNELSEAHIPLEANLWGAVSFTKGCYIGQEIIARMESRGRLAKTLVGLKLAAEVVPGAEVRCDGVNVGVVSSAVVSPQAGPIALAFVKPAFAETGAQLDIGGVAGEVAAFPIV
ncbi:MAG: folate-binding protein YgfZ [Chloroflexi bacterium]|nr:folate-binding protein YgfZ [Chloroflexota bacterium]